jgi:FkbM family methyltransferase
MLHKIALKHLSKNRRQLVVFSFDFVAQQINLTGGYEFDELDVFFEWAKTVAPPDFFDGTALDVGANIGNHSLYFSDLFDLVFSFEPNYKTNRVLQLNSELVSNVKCFDFGLSDADRETYMTTSNANIGGATVARDDADVGLQKIVLKRLDSVSEVSGEVKLIKIDVEGHELSVLKGAYDVITRNKPVILFEQHPIDFDGDESRVINLLKNYGYSKFITVMKYPRAPNELNNLLRWMYAIVGRVIFGSRMKVIVESKPRPGFYSFIAAVPDSFSIDSSM